jgi:Tfp pilus assembly protein PilV
VANVVTARTGERERGFASLEVLVAGTLAAIALLSIAAMLLTARYSVGRSGEISIAAALSRQILEAMGDLPYDRLTALDGFDTDDLSSLPATDPERTVARRWRYALAGEGDGWTFSATEKARWTTLAPAGTVARGRIDVGSPSGSLRAITITLTGGQLADEVRLGTVVGRLDP